MSAKTEKGTRPQSLLQSFFDDCRRVGLVLAGGVLAGGLGLTAVIGGAVLAGAGGALGPVAFAATALAVGVPAACCGFLLIKGCASGLRRSGTNKRNLAGMILAGAALGAGITGGVAGYGLESQNAANAAVIAGAERHQNNHLSVPLSPVMRQAVDAGVMDAAQMKLVRQFAEKLARDGLEGAYAACRKDIKDRPEAAGSCGKFAPPSGP